MVLDHHDDRPLVDGEESVCVPVLAFAERVDEAELAPEALAVPLQEVPQHGHDLGGRIGQARERGRRADRAVVVVGSMRRVTPWIVAGRQPPAGFAVALEFARIRDAVGAVDADVMHVLCPVVGVSVREPAGIEAAERVVGEEQRAAIGHAER